MRLLDVFSLEIESGFDDAAAGLTDDAKALRRLWDIAPSEPSYAVPPYAIVSHRWVGQEVVFQDFESVLKAQLRSPPPVNPVPKTAVGDVENVGQGTVSSIYKIAGACERVRGTNTGIRHIWIDTVCINKLDGRELSSAINSMFRWYHNAAVCHVYLYDVTWDAAADLAGSRSQFLQSKWFTRGWTLQELLAPKRLEFFDRDWRYIGSKQELVEHIAQATGISREHLLGDFRAASIAQKMSWLSRRTTSIIEDRAYCMLGLFGVFLDARYGYGADEFMRLQSVIFNSWPLSHPFDESLFAWTTDKIESSGLLAPAPSCFRNSGRVVFKPGLARSRIPKLCRAESRSAKSSINGAPTKPGMRVDSTYAVDFHVPMWFNKPAMQIAAIASIYLTFGTIIFAAGTINSVARRSKSEHWVNMNCWVRGPKQELRTVRIKVIQEKDKTWRRIECDRLYESSDANLYSQADVHGSAGRVFFPHRIKYRS